MEVIIKCVPSHFFIESPFANKHAHRFIESQNFINIG